MAKLPRIITADCSFPKEIDDGLYVEPMDEDYELYKVGVCVVDTSNLFNYRDIVQQAHAKTAARYWDLPNGERGYDPMIETGIIKGLEFTAGNVRDAMVVNFLIGRKQAPSELNISFNKVKVSQNLNYKQFAKYTQRPEGEKFRRAKDLIKGYLGYVAYGDHTGSRPAWREADDTAVPSLSRSAWEKGSKINEAFMIAANHLVGKALAEEGRPAIYRVHDPNDEQLLELLSASAAHYSRTPGPHSGLNLEPYCRVTSPLRRLDDFVMNHQLKKRFLGKAPSMQDTKEVAFAIRRLNQEIVAAAPKEASRISVRDILGKAAMGPAVEPAIGF